MTVFRSRFVAAALGLALSIYAQIAGAASLLPNGEQTFLDSNGKPIAMGCVYFYTPGTNVPKDTWVNPGGTATNTNPVVLDAAGRAIIYGTGTYRQVVTKPGIASGSPCSPPGEQVWDQLTADTFSTSTIFAGASSGTPNAITVVASEFTGTDGQIVNYISTSTNTGGATFNPSGFGAVQIVRDTSNGPQPLVGGELVATNAVSLMYDTTAGVFHIMSPVNWPNDASVPVGVLIPFAGFTPPPNYAFAYGQAVNRTSYPALLSALTFTQTGSISSGSPTITGLADTTQLGYGVAVEAIGIPGGATVLSCTANSCTMSANATTTRSGNMVFFPYGAGDGSLTFNLPNLRGRLLSGRDNMGGTAAGTMQVSTTMSTTSASPTATVASASGLSIGMVVVNPNVPANTKIAAISGTTITLDVNATTTALNAATRFSAMTDAQVLGATGGSPTTVAMQQVNLPSVNFAVTIPAGQGNHQHTGPIQNSGASFSGSAPGSGTNFTTPSTINTNFATLPAMSGTAASGGSALPIVALSPTININYAIRLTP